jgi:hypothetical protein
VSKVTIAVAADITEADEIRRLLTEAGIPSELEAAEVDLVLPAGDGPCRVLVEAGAVESATDALSAAYRDDADDDDLG